MTMSAPCAMAVSCPSMKFRCAPCASSTMRYIPYLCVISAKVPMSDMTPSYVGDVMITALGFLPFVINVMIARSSLSGDISPNISVLSDTSRSSPPLTATLSGVSRSPSPRISVPSRVSQSSLPQASVILSDID